MGKITLIAGVVSLLSAAAAASGAIADPFSYIEGGRKVGIVADREACEAQPTLPWCDGATVYEAQADYNWTDAEVHQIAESLTKRFFYSYRYGRPWRSSVMLASEGKEAWRADCAGVTFTTLEKLAASGFPTDQMWRLIVIPNTRRMNPERPSVMHMVGVVKVNDEYWVVGDTNNIKPYRLSQAEFVPQMASKVSEGRMWKRTVELPVRY